MSHRTAIQPWYNYPLIVTFGSSLTVFEAQFIDMRKMRKNRINNFKLSWILAQSLQLLRWTNWEHQIGLLWWGRSQTKNDSAWRESHWGYSVQASAQRYHQSSSLAYKWTLIGPPRQNPFVNLFSISIGAFVYTLSLSGLDFKNICALHSPWFLAPLV